MMRLNPCGLPPNERDGACGLPLETATIAGDDSRMVRWRRTVMAESMDRNLGLEAVRVTEAAALAASRLMGRGD